MRMPVWSSRWIMLGFCARGVMLTVLVLLAAPAPVTHAAEPPAVPTPVADDDPQAKLLKQLLGRWRAKLIEGEPIQEGWAVTVTYGAKGKGAVDVIAGENKQAVGFVYAVAGADTLSVVMDDAPDEEPVVFRVRFEYGALVMIEQKRKVVSRLVRIDADGE